MSIYNYISKLLFINKISSSLKTSAQLIINSKKYSSTFKSNNLDLANKEVEAYSLKFNGKKCNLKLRTYSGDIDIFYEIYWKLTYEDHLKHYKKNPKTIVDLGAHIGLTSNYFSLKFPQAKIISVEASEENYSLLKHNTQDFTQITAVHAAAYKEDGYVKFTNNLLSYNQKISSEGIETKAISMVTLMKNYQLKTIDLLKIDIEGGEIELLKNNNDWLNLVDHILIEIHHPYTKEELVQDLQPFNFHLKSIVGDVLFLSKV